jgi:hypothetical protein
MNECSELLRSPGAQKMKECSELLRSPGAQTGNAHLLVFLSFFFPNGDRVMYPKPKTLKTQNTNPICTISLLDSGLLDANTGGV